VVAVMMVRTVVPVVRRAMATPVMVVARRRVVVVMVVVSTARPVPGDNRVGRGTVGVGRGTVGGVSGRPSEVRGMRAGRRPGQQNHCSDGGDPTHGGASDTAALRD
jgi:hypothetical protein